VEAPTHPLFFPGAPRIDRLIRFSPLFSTFSHFKGWIFAGQGANRNFFSLLQILREFLGSIFLKLNMFNFNNLNN
jgi:hypothetical protein